jgi:hypothetical protein
MALFTRSRMREVFPYGESVTKLLASDLVEKGTQCPVCCAEISPDASIYLHRGCANILCSSCFESNLAQELVFDICPICNGHLAEPCHENAIPNWPFTYTNIPFPASSRHSSSDDPGPPGPSLNGTAPSNNTFPWSPILSPWHRFHSGGKGQPVASVRPTYNAAGPLAGMSATLEKLKADLTEQRKIMRDLRGQKSPSRDNNNSRFLRRGNTNPLYENNRNSRYHANKDSEPLSKTNHRYPGNGNFQHHNKPSFQQEDDANVQPPNSRTQYNPNPQHDNSTNPQPKHNPNPRNPRNQHNTNPEHENSTNPWGPKLKISRHQNGPNPRQHHKPGPSNLQGPGPSLNQYRGPLAQFQQRPPHPYARRRGQPNNEGPRIDLRDNVWHAPGPGGKRDR